jgi:MFS family permease
MAIMDVQIVTSSLTQTQGGLSATADEIAWVQTVCLIADVVIVPLSGTMSRLLSTRVLFVAAALGFTGASVLCATATSLGEMILYRARCKASAAAPVTSRLAAGSVRADGARLGRSRPRADATRNRKFADSPLEGRVTSELVSELKFRSSQKIRFSEVLG